LHALFQFSDLLFQRVAFLFQILDALR